MQLFYERTCTKIISIIKNIILENILSGIIDVQLYSSIKSYSKIFLIVKCISINFTELKHFKDIIVIIEEKKIY